MIKNIIFIINFLLLNIAVIFAFQIDNVSIDLHDGMFIVSGPQGQIINHMFEDSVLQYGYILETPYFKLSGYDGFVELDGSKGLRNFPKEDLTAEDFTKFSFFTREKNTIGLLIGGAGASGGCYQDVYFIDTHTGRFIKIELLNMQEMKWITENGQIIGYKNYDTDFYLGGHVNSWGCKARVSDVVFFDGNGDITIDTKALRDICEEEYSKISFSNDEKMLLQKNVMYEKKCRPLGEKLVDFVYYGVKIGKRTEVFKFLNTLNRVYTQEADVILKDYDFPA